MRKYLYYSLSTLFFISCGNLKKLDNGSYSVGIINNVSNNTTSKNEAGEEYEEKYDFENNEDEVDEKGDYESISDKDSLGLEGRDILFLGEGNFTFVKSFIKNHPELNGRIIATEIKDYSGFGVFIRERIKL